MIELEKEQLKAVNELRNGNILCSTTGSGKTRTALAYYYKDQGGDLYSETPCLSKDAVPLYVITTAKKRDSRDWEDESVMFGFEPAKVDSWNNIQKYKTTVGAFFIFDEQRAVGDGPWAKTFVTICKHNRWVLLSATPGDNWKDYAAVFIANGFYKNVTEYKDRHYIVARYGNYPILKGYREKGRLLRLKESILVRMDNYKSPAEQHHKPVSCVYDLDLYRKTMRSRWDPYKDEPFTQASQLCFALRRICNSDQSRTDAVLRILEDHPKAIIFYNYDFELEILRALPVENMAEWNGHKHEPIPSTDSWVYLVNYSSGSEGWNCIETDTMIFFSQTYSYKVLAQSIGRIDRRNTPFRDLYYYHLSSASPIDRRIKESLDAKKEFNEKRFLGKLFEK